MYIIFMNLSILVFVWLFLFDIVLIFLPFFMALAFLVMWTFCSKVRLFNPRGVRFFSFRLTFLHNAFNLFVWCVPLRLFIILLSKQQINKIRVKFKLICSWELIAERFSSLFLSSTGHKNGPQRLISVKTGFQQKLYILIHLGGVTTYSRYCGWKNICSQKNICLFVSSPAQITLYLGFCLRKSLFQPCS